MREYDRLRSIQTASLRTVACSQSSVVVHACWSLCVCVGVGVHVVHTAHSKQMGVNLVVHVFITTCTAKIASTSLLAMPCCLHPCVSRLNACICARICVCACVLLLLLQSTERGQDTMCVCTRVCMCVIRAQIGLNGVDNGAIRFTHVRVPRVNLLDRFGTVDKSGRYSSPLTSQARRWVYTHSEHTVRGSAGRYHVPKWHGKCQRQVATYITGTCTRSLGDAFACHYAILDTSWQ